MALARAEPGLVHVEVLVQPARVYDSGSDGSVDGPHRVVVRLAQAQSNVNVARLERGDLTVLVVGERHEREMVQARAAAACVGGTRPVVVTDKVDPIRSSA